MTDTTLTPGVEETQQVLDNKIYEEQRKTRKDILNTLKKIATLASGVGEIQQVSDNKIPEEKIKTRESLNSVLNQMREYGKDGCELAEFFGRVEGLNLDILEHDHHLNDYIRKKIDEGRFDIVEEMLKKYSRGLGQEGVFDSEIADILCKYGHPKLVYNYFYSFKSLSNFTYDKIKDTYLCYREFYLDKGQELKVKDLLLRNIDIIEDHNYIVNDLITSGEFFKHYKCKFKRLNNQTVKSLLLSEQGNLFFGMGINEDTFIGLDKEVFKMLLNNDRFNADTFDSYKFGCIMKKSFTGLDRESFKYLLDYYNKSDLYDEERKVLKKIIEENLGIFGRLNKDDAKALIESGLGLAVIKNLKVFESLDKEIDELLEKNLFKYLLDLYNELGSDMAKKVLKKIIEENLGAFPGLDKNDAKALIESGLPLDVINNLEIFEGLDKEIVMFLMECGYGWDVINNLEIFEGLLDKEIVMFLMECGHGWDVVDKLEEFGLKKEA